MHGLRMLFGAAVLAMVAGSGCCRWWCNNCERFCGGRHVAAPAPVVAAPTACVPVVCCPAPVCCPPGMVTHSAPVMPAQWQRCP